MVAAQQQINRMRPCRGGRDEDPHYRPGGQQQARSPRSCGLDQAARSSGGVPAAWPPGDLPAFSALLDLTGVSFCDARGLSAFVRIANQADAAGCGFGLIAPRPPVAKILRISGLDSRMPVFATIDDARALRTATAGV